MKLWQWLLYLAIIWFLTKRKDVRVLSLAFVLFIL